MVLDDDALRRAQAGDLAVGRLIIEQHQDAVLAEARTEERTEAVFLAVLAALPRYRLGADKLAAWIATLARSRAAADGSPLTALSSGFADRVLAAHRARAAAASDDPGAVPDPLAARSRRRSPMIIAIVATASVIALAVAQLRGHLPERVGAGPPASGSVTAELRTTLELGGRATAVAERGTAVAWTLAADPPRVDQRTGTVRYDFRPGPPIHVATPHGGVEVSAGELTVVVAAASSSIHVHAGVITHGGAPVAPGTVLKFTADAAAAPAPAP